MGCQVRLCYLHRRLHAQTARLKFPPSGLCRHAILLHHPCKLSRHPAHRAACYHGDPAIGGRGHIGQIGARRHLAQAAIVQPVALADVDAPSVVRGQQRARAVARLRIGIRRRFRIRRGHIPTLIAQERQLIPILKVALAHPRAHAAIIKPAPLHQLAVADIVAHMSILAQRQSQRFRQSGNRPRGQPLLFA